MYKIIRREAFSDTTFLWEVNAPDVARSAEPGHFVMLRMHEGGERIPLTVADYDRDRGTITLVIQALGKTTLEMRDHYKAGDSIVDFVGPLGLPQHVSQAGHVVLVGGGLGVAPVYPQLRAFKEAGNRTTGIIGFRNKDLVFWEETFGRYCDDLIVCTDDGSYGKPGFVTAALQEVLERDRPDLVIAIGPLPMMNACVETTRPFRREDDGVAERDHGRRHRHVRLVPRHRRQRDQVRLRRRPRLRRPPGRLQGADRCARNGSRARRRRRTTDYAHVCNVEKVLFEQGKHNYKKYKDLAPLATRMPERDRAGARAQLQGGQPRLLDGRRDGRGRALHPCAASRPASTGCPVGIDIPRFIRHLLVRDIDGAQAVINESNLFPSVCGRVCPQESQCEAQCVVGRKFESVAIGRLERFVGDNARPRKVEPPRFERAARPGGHRRLRPVGPGGGGRPARATAATSPSSRRCTWSAACCSTASRRSACRATSSAARSTT